MMQEIIEAMDAADADDEVRRLSLRVQEEFCAGADLSAGKDAFNNDAPGKQSGLQRDGGGLLTLRLFESKKPLISA